MTDPRDPVPTEPKHASVPNLTPTLAVGTTQARDQVSIVVTIPMLDGDPVRAEFLYDQEELSKFCLGLVQAGQRIEKARPKSGIVMPFNGGNTRIPMDRRPKQ